jgi:hypothetical protein
MTKVELFPKFEKVAEQNDSHDLIKYLFDWFNCAELEELLDFIKDEGGFVDE